MKKIVRDIISFIIPLLIIVILIDAFSFTSIGNVLLGKITYSTGYARSGSADVRKYIKKVMGETQATKLIVGDSVARQLFEGMQDDGTYCIAACNQALTLAGQYLLIESFLERNSDATDVYLCIIPMSLNAELDAKRGYNYFVVPFTQESLMDKLDISTQIYKRKIWGNFCTELDDTVY